MREPGRESTYELAADWKTRCLDGDDSLLFPGEKVWTLDALGELMRDFVERPDLGKRKFIEKFRDQLANVSVGAVKLAAEVVALHVLYPSNLRASTKRASVASVLALRHLELPPDAAVVAAFESGGIGGAGQAYNQRKPDEIALLIRFAHAWKSKPPAAPDDPWSVAEYIDELDNADRRQMRHVVLHFLFPESFERVVSNRERHRVDRAFRSLVGANEDANSLDKRLLAVRRELEKIANGRRIDFYESWLRDLWDDESGGEDEEDPLDALLHKKQIVLFGPPGTGKTFEAEALARRLLRQAMVRSLGGAWYVENHALVESISDAHVHRQQLHPAYGYEDFVRGIHIEPGGTTRYRRGFLPTLLDEITLARKSTSKTASLPHVLILDEMNRADLSRMLGECFSLLENRDSAIPLAGFTDPAGQPEQVVLSLPNDLFVIGTMNLIDQSLEQVDFALRRRFFWCERRFDATVLAKQLAVRKGASSVLKKHDLDADFRRFVAAANDLNQAVIESESLGDIYELGHTYFFDIVRLLESDLANAKRRTGYLWKADRASGPLTTLWRWSLKPLLEEYLRGLSAPERSQEIMALQKKFLERAPVDEDA